MKELSSDLIEDKLWNAVVAFQKYPFHTATGIPFTYEIRKGRNGE